MSKDEEQAEQAAAAGKKQGDKFISLNAQRPVAKEVTVAIKPPAPKPK